MDCFFYVRFLRCPVHGGLCWLVHFLGVWDCLQELVQFPYVRLLVFFRGVVFILQVLVVVTSKFRHSFCASFVLDRQTTSVCTVLNRDRDLYGRRQWMDENMWDNEEQRSIDGFYLGERE